MMNRSFRIVNCIDCGVKVKTNGVRIRIRCVDCRKIYQQKYQIKYLKKYKDRYKAYKKAYFKKYYHENKERLLTKNKKHRADNPELYKSYGRKYYHKKKQALHGSIYENPELLK